MGEWPTVLKRSFTAFQRVIVLWYTLFALLASTSAREQGTAIARIGVWFFFTFLWALVTTMVAYASGVAVGEANDPMGLARGNAGPAVPQRRLPPPSRDQLPTVVEGGAMAVLDGGRGLDLRPWWALHRRMERLVP